MEEQLGCGRSVAAAKGRLFHGASTEGGTLTLKQTIAGRNAATFDCWSP